MQRLGEAIGQTTRFELDPTEASSSTALNLLHRYGTLICSSNHSQLYELEIPRPDRVKQGGLPGLHDAQWWVEKSAAETKTGPYAEDDDVKRAEAHIRGKQTKKKNQKVPTARERQIDLKLQERLRRREAGSHMYDDDDVKEESQVREEVQDNGAEEDRDRVEECDFEGDGGLGGDEEDGEYETFTSSSSRGSSS